MLAAPKPEYKTRRSFVFEADRVESRLIRNVFLRQLGLRGFGMRDRSSKVERKSGILTKISTSRLAGEAVFMFRPDRAENRAISDEVLAQAAGLTSRKVFRK